MFLALLLLLVIIFIWYSAIRFGHFNTVAVRVEPIRSPSPHLILRSDNEIAPQGTEKGEPSFPVDPDVPCPGGACPTYNVHRAHDDQLAAAELLREITLRIDRLTQHLRQKYEQDARPFSPDHAGRIDVVPMSQLFYLFAPADETQRKDAIDRERIQQRVQQLVDNYHPETIREISPLNREGLTSYTEDKNRLVLCLRRKEADAAGRHPLHDPNTMMFVVIHELTHMMNDSWGHPADFWVLFKFMLQNAAEAGVYSPVDYSRHPVVYCGLPLNYNPYFDGRL